MLREARIVMPQLNTAVSIAAHQKLRHVLVEAFGGYTVYNGIGAWRSPDRGIVNDMILIYDIAVDADRDNSYELLARLAIDAGRALQQQSVYVRYPNGNVDIIEVRYHDLGPTLDRDAVVADMGDGRSALLAVGPGQRWTTRDGGEAFVGKKATVFDGGFYATLIKSQPGYMAGFEYVIDTRGRLAGSPWNENGLDLQQLLSD